VSKGSGDKTCSWATKMSVKVPQNYKIALIAKIIQLLEHLTITQNTSINLNVEKNKPKLQVPRIRMSKQYRINNQKHPAKLYITHCQIINNHHIAES